MYRVALVTNKGEVMGKNFDTKNAVDNYLLEIMESQGIKYFKIKDKTTGIIIETEQGKR